MHNATLNRFEWLKAVMQAEGLTATAKNVATALAVQFANAETGQINPSQETLADFLKVHRDTVKRVMRELRNAGWLMATGDGGRGKAPLLRLLTPGKIIPFRARKGGVICPAQEEKRGDDLQQKGGQIAPSHYKEEQSLEQRGAQIPIKRPAVLDQFKDTRFAGRATSDLQAVPKSDFSALNKWTDWLRDERLPKLYELPISQQAKKSGEVFFWLPSKTPPTTSEATRQTRQFFETIVDKEAVRHAAQ